MRHERRLGRLIVPFVACLAAVGAVADGASGKTPVGAMSVGAQLGASIGAQLPQAEQAARQAVAARETPAARADQRRSTSAFAGLGPAAALAADKGAFPQLDSVPWSASMLVPKGGRLESYIGTGKQDALVSFAGVKRRAVLESAAPLIGISPSGAAAPADSALERVTGGFAPVSAPSVMHMPADASGTLSFANLGIGIGVLGARNSTGELVAGRAWYPSALPDTDLGWAATPAGAADLSMVLRSPASPQTISLALTLPPGVSVRPSGPLDAIPAPPGSLEIAAGNARLALIQPASAIDAQGRAVPVTYSLTSPGVVAVHVTVPTDAAYPIVVDPATQPVVEAYPGGGQLNEVGACWNNWGFYTNNTGYEPLVEPAGGSTDALFLFAGTGYSYTAGSSGECARLAPAKSFIYQVQFYNSSLVPSVYPVTSTEGLYDAGTLTYMAGGWTNQTNPAHLVTGSDAGYAVHGFVGPWAGQVYQLCAAACSPATTTVPDGSYAFISLAAYTSFASGANPPYTASGTASTYASDRYAPIAGTDTETPTLPTGWVKNVSETSVLGASDDGLGMHTIAVSGPGVVAQTGYALSASAVCNGTSQSPCPAIFTTPSPPSPAALGWKTTSATPDGIDTVIYTDSDIVGNATQTTHQIKIDTRPPTFAPTGSLESAVTASAPLTMPLYYLAATANDPLSGVASVSASIDCSGVTFPTVTQTPATGQSLTSNLTLNTSACSRGTHTITLTATDGAGNVTSPATALTFDVEPQLGGATYSQYESQQLDDRMGLSENIGTGGLTLTATDIAIAGTGVALDVTRTYNAQQAAHPDATDLSPGWRLSIGPDVHLTALPPIPTVLPYGGEEYFGPSGETYTFATTATGTFAQANGLPATLTGSVVSGFTMTFYLTNSLFTFAAPATSTGPAPLSTQADKNTTPNVIRITYVSGTCAAASGCEVSAITGTQGQSLAFTYNAAGQVIQIADTNGRTWKYHYTSGVLDTYTDPTAAITAYSYQAGLLHTITDPNNDPATAITYLTTAAVPQVATVTQPDGTATAPSSAVTSFVYVNNGTQTNVTSPANAGTPNFTAYQLDGLGRVVLTTDPDGFATATSWTTNPPTAGQTASKALTKSLASDPATGATIDTTYNGADDYRPNSSTDNKTASSSCTYPTSGVNTYVPSTCTDDLNHTLSYTYDADNNLKTVTGVVSGTTQTPVNLFYNANGTLDHSIDGDGNATTYQYNPNGNGQLYGTTPPLPQGATATRYDAFGRVMMTTDGAGRTVNYTYDANDRVQTESYTGGVTITYAYDGNGNLLTMTDSRAAMTPTTYTPDQANRLIAESTPGPNLLGGYANQTYTYDGDNNLTGLFDGAYDNETFHYDPADRLGNVTANLIGGGQQVWNYTPHYSTPDPLTGGMYLTSTTITDPNGITETDTLTSGQLTDIRYTGTAGTLQDFNYNYAITGQPPKTSDLVQSLTHATATTTYAYDTFNRLTSATVSTGASNGYVYDGAGNRTSQTINGGTPTTFVYNTANELTSIGSRAFGYDASGDQLTDNGNYNAGYNQLNQTNNFTNANSPLSPVLTPSYLGPGQANRTSIMPVLIGNITPTDSILGTTSIDNPSLLPLGLSGNDNTTSGTTQVIRDPAGNILGLSITSTLLGIPLGGTTNYTYATDQQGSVAAVYDPAQTPKDSYTYDPYGKTTVVAEAAPQPFRFQGQYQDESNLYHMGQRYYDPSTGRWLQTDPLDQIADPTQANAYAFGADNPGNVTDPSGETLSKHVVKGLACLALLGVACKREGDNGSLAPVRLKVPVVDRRPARKRGTPPRGRNNSATSALSGISGTAAAGVGVNGSITYTTTITYTVI